MKIANFTPPGKLQRALGSAKEAAAGALILGLDIRVPTTTKHMSEAQRNEILSKIQPGDVCLETNDAYPGWQRLEFLTSKSRHTHAFTYEGDGKILHSTTPDGVQRTDLADYLKGRIHVKVVRPDYESAQDVQQSLEYQRGQLGKPYNRAFDTADTSAYYCFQLTAEGLEHTDHPIAVEKTKTAGHNVYTAKALEELPGATVIVDDHCSFVKSQLSHWPVFAGTLATTAAAFAGMNHFVGLGAAAAAVPVAFLGGLALSICTGNKIQTGHFSLAGGTSEEA